ncbi:MAG: response regulator [Polyangiales bacterium]|jgi:two-component system response regulator RegA
MNEAPRHSTPGPSILLVDDDDRLRSRMARAFEERGYEAQQAEGYEGAVAIAEHESTEYAVVDLRMPGKSGLEVVRALHRIDPATKIVVLTAYGSIATALEAVRLGATHYLTKPADVDEVIASFHRGDVGSDTAETLAHGEKPQTPSLARVEWEHIQRVLTDCGGNITKAAEKLGIHRRSLQRKLAKFPTLR